MGDGVLFLGKAKEEYISSTVGRGISIRSDGRAKRLTH